MLAGITYQEVNDEGLVISVDGEQQTLQVDNVIICAGQESERGLYQQLEAQGVIAHLIGGANVAAELDAKQAIRQAAELAAKI
jgi:2,4-dienoyl-CoA reductase (NADPH2)